jgi:hypothetical protein
MSRKEKDRLRQERWENNQIQFPRLLAEIYEGGCISREGWTYLHGSMGLNQLELEEIFLRAETEWEELKEMALAEEQHGL